MNIYKAGLCFLPSLLLVIFSFGTVKSAPECRGKDCKLAFACPGAYNCTCSRAAGDYELLCPGTGLKSVLSASIMPTKYIHILCTYDTHFTDYNLLKGLTLGPVTSVNFRGCPLPNMPFSEFNKAIGVNYTSTLLFQSYQNLSNTLERKHFTGLVNLTRLMLSSNGLTDLPEDLLQDLKNLTWLDLRGNNMKLHVNFFNSVPNLQALELGNNNLSGLEPGIFRNLTKLRLLNLWKNQLRNLTRNVLSPLENLEKLDLSNNGMTSLPSDVFQDLRKLLKTSLHSNNFSHIPENLFSNNSKLESLRLHDNRQPMTLPKNFLSNLTNLEEVYLMRNYIKSLPENIFWLSTHIKNISLLGNSIEEIPLDLFRDQISLRTLDISYNQLRKLPDGVFQNLRNLEFLKLGNNRLQNITRYVFEGLTNLELLNLENNELSFMDGDALAPMKLLKHARFSHNFLSFLDDEGLPVGVFKYKDSFGNKSPLRYSIHLEYLYLANNSITEIFTDWNIALIQLKVLDLSYNRIPRLLVQDVHFISKDLSVDLRYNNISTIDLRGIETLSMAQDSDSALKTRRILLEGNPLRCDCQIYDMIRLFENKLVPQVQELVTLVPGNLTCKSPAKLEGMQATKIKSYDLTCVLEDERNCPRSCECSVRRADWALIVNCTGRGLTEVPRILPIIEYTRHTELLLNDNKIHSLPNTTFVGYENITRLELSGNKISSIDTGFLSVQIQELSVDHNNLTMFNSHVIQFLGHSRHISLLKINNNPWMCDCTNKDILDLIQMKFQQIPNLKNVTCSEDNRPLSKLSVSDLCPVSMAVIISCVSVAAFGILIGSLAFLYYRYQREIKVWLYSHQFCLWFVTEQELDKDKIYDAFVSYSHKDENFVINTLVPELESGDCGFKLCLHYRDWIAGEWIPNQIARSVENSRRTLVVLSPNFLESVWGRMEFRAAHKQALSEGRARVIVVLYGDVGPTEQLDPELRAYISMNTYVKWGDPWFWRKLKYALPHPPSIVRNNLQLFKGRGSRKENKYIDDKLELIHTLDSPSRVGGSTPPAEAVVTTMETVTIPSRNGIAKPVA